MEKVMLKVFTLAAAAVAPHLIALDTKDVKVRQIEQLSVEECVEMEAINEIAFYDSKETPTES